MINTIRIRTITIICTLLLTCLQATKITRSLYQSHNNHQNIDVKGMTRSKITIGTLLRRPNCAPGTYLYFLTWTCIRCSSGTYQSKPNQSTCLPCPSGTQSNTRGTACIKCVPGTYASFGTCISCTGATFQSKPGQSKCIPCSKGSQPNNAHTSCSSCSPGTYFDNAFSQTCQPCSGGSYQPRSGETTCIPCPKGKQSNTQRTACIACKPGSFFNTNTYPFRCTPCPGGSFQPASGKTSCRKCQNGWQSNSQRTACIQCKAGSYFESSSAFGRCATCAGGTFQPLKGKTKCMKCKQGWESNWSRTSCKPCQPGTFFNSLRYYLRCTPCESGFYQPGKAKTSCLKCPIGWASNFKRTACSPCPRGSYYNDNKYVLRCAVCPGGTYQPFKGQTRCLICPEGSEHNPTRTRCRACKPGYFLNERSAQRSCTPCPPGWYQPKPRQIKCVRCPPGKSSASGATKCI